MLTEEAIPLLHQLNQYVFVVEATIQTDQPLHPLLAERINYGRMISACIVYICLCREAALQQGCGEYTIGDDDGCMHIMFLYTP